MKRKPIFATERELCAAFIAWVKAKGWIAYPETEGWDILLVHPEDGTQVGVQAKLKFNTKVLDQAVESWYGNEVGPDYRAILVPESVGSHSLCGALGLTLIEPRKFWDGRVEFVPDFSARAWKEWHYCNPRRRHTLPQYVPDVPAGVPAPAQLTRWKIGALKISAILELRGYVTRRDFKLCGIDHRRWTQDWLEPMPEKPGAWRWPEGTARSFAAQHPVIYGQVLEEVRAANLHVERPEKVLL